MMFNNICWCLSDGNVNGDVTQSQQTKEGKAGYNITALVQAISSHIEKEILKARIDTISDMIIECYAHDNPLEIAKELEAERKRLEANLNSQIGVEE